MQVRFVLGGGDAAHYPPSVREVAVPDDGSTPTTLRDLALAAGVPLPGTCGGKGTCGKCRVVVRGPVSDVTPEETRHLTPSDLAAGVRLACRTRPLGGRRRGERPGTGPRGEALGDVIVRVPCQAAATILTAGRPRRLRLAPNVRRIHLDVTLPPGIQAGTQTLVRALTTAGIRRPQLSPHAMGLLAEGMVAGAQHLLVTLVGNQVADLDVIPLVEPPAVPAPIQSGALATAGEPFRRSDRPACGLAFDVGTTTVVAYLMDLETGRRLAVASGLNPQAAHGADVVSRLALALSDPHGLDRLAVAIRGALNDLADRAAQQAAVPLCNVYEATLVGNTAMHHLLLGLNPASLAYAPYLPAITRPLDLPACAVGLNIAPGGRIHLLPNIAGYVGADTVGVILATGLDRSTRLSLAMDIGTNGEMVLGSRGRLLACSTAAGPAFEGARISCGMIAAQGAIDRADVVDGDLRLHVIGGGAATGICGSGLVDVAALLLRWGLLEASGRLRAPDGLPPDVPAALGARLVVGPAGTAFVLQPGGAGAARLTLTQRDLRELQLAKAAIRAGLEILMNELAVQPDRIQRLYLAGAFGNYLRPESARDIGLLPPVPLDRVWPVGNAAGTGAQMALLSLAARRRAARVARKVEYLELAARRDFQDVFVGSMGFGIL